MAKVNGTCDSRFTAVKDLLQANINADEELGASIVVNVNGENVVDIWGGYSDPSKSKFWEEDTVTNVWSSSKTVVSLAALLLIDRGLIDPFENVSKYWPEFAQNGKENIEVRHFLSHSSGLSGWADPIAIHEVCDLESSTTRLAAQAPWWTPGSASGYHSLTMGHLLNELTQRVTSKSLAEFVTTELAGPLDADFTFGVPTSEYHRVATIIPPPAPPADWKPDAPTDTDADPKPKIDMSSIFAKTLMNPLMDANFANQDFWRQACVPAANGFTNARGIAKLLSIISCSGTLDGKQWLKPQTVDLIFEEQTNGPDLVISAKTRFGIGFGLNGVEDGGAGHWIPDGKICFWGGWGGSMVVCDVGRGVTITYMMNKMSNAGLGSGLAKYYIWEVYKALGVEVTSETDETDGVIRHRDK